MKLKAEILEGLIEEVYTPEYLAQEIDRRVEEEIHNQVAYEASVFNVWLASHHILDGLRTGKLSVIETPTPLYNPIKTYRGPRD